MEQFKGDGWLKVLCIKDSTSCGNLPTNCACGLQIAMAKTTEPDEKGESGLLQYAKMTRINKAEMDSDGEE